VESLAQSHVEVSEEKPPFFLESPKLVSANFGPVLQTRTALVVSAGI
jgi:hypothetical protein